jgi:4'-phosphopantetheinyl transferase
LTPLTFSHSRSRAAWLLAVAPHGHRVGADIEYLRPLAGNDVPRICLTRAERAFVLDGTRGNPAERRVRFYRCWTRKESVVKATGMGIAADLSLIETRPERPEAATVLVGGPGAGRFRLTDLSPALPGLAACVAIEREFIPKTTSPFHHQSRRNSVAR